MRFPWLIRKGMHIGAYVVSAYPWRKKKESKYLLPKNSASYRNVFRALSVEEVSVTWVNVVGHGGRTCTNTYR